MLYLTSREASTVLCFVKKNPWEPASARKKCKEKHSTTTRVSPHFLSALAAS